MFLSRLTASVSLAIVSISLAGCSNLSHTAASSTESTPISGIFHGGQQAITGVTVQLYAAGTTGDASAATPRLTKTVTTSDGTGNATNANANVGNNYNALPAGSFTITGDYTCPSPTSEMYVVGTGGNPGQTSSNSTISLMAALGPCNSLAGIPYVTVNEVTTIASLINLSPYMSSLVNLGSGTSDASAFASAFTAVTEYTNIATGTAPGSALPAGMYASSTEIDTLANVLAYCINSTGGVANDGTPCGTFYQLAKPATGTAPTDAIGAILDILNNPNANLTALFNLSFANAPFQPADTVAPPSWNFPILSTPATPSFTLAAGSYTGAQLLTLTDAASGASIYYTVGVSSTPTAASTLYTGPISIASSETVNAIAVTSSRASSATASAAYTIVASSVASAPSFFPAGGEYNATQSVTLVSPTPGASIYYTLDGSTPTVSSTHYTGAISVAATETVNAIATASGYTASPITASAYVIGSGSTGYITTVAGTGTVGSTGDGGMALEATLNYALGLAVDAGGSYYIADRTAGTVRKVSPAGIVSTVTSSVGSQPSDVIVDAAGNIYFVDVASFLVRKISVAGVITTIAGDGNGPSYCALTQTFGATAGNGDGGQATSAQVCPLAIALDSSGNLFIADNIFYTIRKVTSAGVISTVAGYPPSTGTTDAPVTSALLQYPNRLVLDTAGNLYMNVDGYVLELTTGGMLTKVVGGSGAFACSTANGVSALTATFKVLSGLAIDKSGNIFVSDQLCAVVREISGGIINTIAGNPNATVLGDGGLATNALFSQMHQIALDAAGNLLVADSSHQRIRKISFGAMPPTASAPTPSLGTGNYTGKQTVSIATTVAGAAIYYTVDGTDPNVSGVLYTGPISIGATETLKAITVANGYIGSTTTSAAYIIQ